MRGACKTVTRTNNLISFAGGGSAGHVTPNLPLIEQLQKEGWDVLYYGTPKGIEREIIAGAAIPYQPIPSGKLRRYFSWQNFLDPFVILWGVLRACLHIAGKRPRVLFSKGGFAAVPPVIGAWLARVPIVIHESDRTPGLANRICSRFAAKICVSYADSPLLADPRTVLTGAPVRESLFHGDRDKALALTGFDGTRPILLCFGGSLGAKAINAALRDALDDLTKTYDVVHVTGAGNLAPSLEGLSNYWQAEFVQEEFADLLAAADVAVSRAGANAIAELVALHIPNLLIPLPLSQSRGDQIENAALARVDGLSAVLPEEELTAQGLITALVDLDGKKDGYRQAMAGRSCDRGGAAVLEVIRGVAGPQA